MERDYKVKRGLFGKKLYDKYHKETLNIPKDSNLEIKYTSSDDFSIFENDTELFPGFKISNISKEAKYDWKKSFEGDDPENTYTLSMWQGAGLYKAKINLLTGKHTPPCKEIKQDYVINKDNEILLLNQDCTTKETGLTKVDDIKSDLGFATCHICKTPNGKFMLLNNSNFQSVVNQEFDDKNITIPYSDGNIKLLSNGHKHYFVNKNGDVISSLEGDEIKKVQITSNGVNGRNVECFVCYDKSKNKTTVVKYGDNESINSNLQVDGLVHDIVMEKDKLFVVVENEDKKMGVVNEKNKEVVPVKYDSIDIKKIEGKRVKTDKVDYIDATNVFVVSLDGKIGVNEFSGKEMVPCSYSNIDISQSYKFDDKVRFFLADENNKWGAVDSKGNTEVEFKYTTTNTCDVVIDKNAKDAKCAVGLKMQLQGYETSDYYYLKSEENCLLKKEDVDIYRENVNNHPSYSVSYDSSKSSQSHTLMEDMTDMNSLTDPETFMWASVTGSLGVGVMIRDALHDDDYENE